MISGETTLRAAGNPTCFARRTASAGDLARRVGTTGMPWAHNNSLAATSVRSFCSCAATAESGTADSTPPQRHAGGCHVPSMIVPPAHPKTAWLPYHWCAGAVKELARQAGDTDAPPPLHRAVWSVKVSDPESSLESGLARGGHRVTSASVGAVEGGRLCGLVAVTLVLMCVASPLLSAQPSSPDPTGAKIPVIVL